MLPEDKCSCYPNDNQNNGRDDNSSNIGHFKTWTDNWENKWTQNYKVVENKITRRMFTLIAICFSYDFRKGHVVVLIPPPASSLHGGISSANSSETITRWLFWAVANEGRKLTYPPSPMLIFNNLRITGVYTVTSFKIHKV